MFLLLSLQIESTQYVGCLKEAPNDFGNGATLEHSLEQFISRIQQSEVVLSDSHLSLKRLAIQCDKKASRPRAGESGKSKAATWWVVASFECQSFHFLKLTSCFRSYRCIRKKKNMQNKLSQQTIVCGSSVQQSGPKGGKKSNVWR